jgi:hypothetical protein
VTIQDAAVGPVTINSITLNNFKGNFKYRSAWLFDAQINVVIQISMDYNWNFPINVGLGHRNPVIKGSANSTFPAINTGWTKMGNVSIRGGNLTLEAPQAILGPITMSLQQVGQISAPTLATGAVSVENAVISTAIPALGGNVPIPNLLGDASAAVDDIEVSDVATNSIMVPPMTVNLIGAPKFTVQSAQTGSFLAKASFIKTTSLLEVPHFQFVLNVNFTSILKASNLVMGNLPPPSPPTTTMPVLTPVVPFPTGSLPSPAPGLTGTIAIDSADASAFDISMTLGTIELNGLQVNGIAVPQINAGGT